MDEEGQDTSFTDSVRKLCPNCGDLVEIPIILHTDGHFADVEVVEDNETDIDGELDEDSSIDEI